MSALRDKSGRFRQREEPDLGPYWIECDLTRLGPVNCNVVDVRRPLPDPGNEGGKGFEIVFTGPYVECDAWLRDNA